MNSLYNDFVKLPLAGSFIKTINSLLPEGSPLTYLKNMKNMEGSEFNNGPYTVKSFSCEQTKWVYYHIVK